MDDPEDAQAILSHLMQIPRQWQFIEMRARTDNSRWRPLFYKSESYCQHLLDLSADLEIIFRGMHAVNWIWADPRSIRKGCFDSKTTWVRGA